MPARYRGPDRLRDARIWHRLPGHPWGAASDSLGALAITGIDEEI
jgi:hypothetical protein